MASNDDLGQLSKDDSRCRSALLLICLRTGVQRLSSTSTQSRLYRWSTSHLHLGQLPELLHSFLACSAINPYLGFILPGVRNSSAHQFNSCTWLASDTQAIHTDVRSHLRWLCVYSLSPPFLWSPLRQSCTNMWSATSYSFHLELEGRFNLYQISHINAVGLQVPDSRLARTCGCQKAAESCTLLVQAV